MDPLTAVSLAGTILQFIDFSSKLVAGTYEIYRSGSGATAENEDIVTVITDLKEVTFELDTDIIGRGKHEKALKALATKCAELSGQLLAVLEKLRTSDKHSAWKSLRVKWASMRKSDEVQKIERRLGEYRSEILMRLTLMLSDQQSSISMQLDQIHNDGKRLSSESAARLSNIRDEILKAVEQGTTHFPVPLEQTHVGGMPVIPQTAQSQPELQEIKAYIESLTSLATTIPVENRILDNIYFASMHNREDTIHDAEMGTLKWLLRDEEATQGPAGGVWSKVERHSKLFEEEQNKRAAARSSFLNWLSTGNGVYHISGKAGSGKSTLIKFLCNHDMTSERLAGWAGDKKLASARFFFWKAGDDLQQSLQGLYRSLLFEVLRQCPELIPRVFPSQWAQLRTSTGANLADKTLFRHHHIFNAFNILIQHSNFPRHRFCFFIDGLDEYNGDSLDHTTLANNLRSWARGEDIKICVSSRPHLEFHDVFSDSPDRRMHLHELTRHDIYIYSYHMIKKAKNSDSIEGEYLSLITQIVYGSGGVFLWAWLVVRMLMSGILRRDPIATLVNTLRTTPRELNDLYSRMLDSLQPHDQKKAAQMLLLVARNRQGHPFSSLAFFWLDHLEDVDFPSSSNISPFSQEGFTSAIDTVDRQVTSMAQGFLESFAFPSPHCQPENSSLGTAGLLGYRFFHRTARDFVLNHPKLGKIVDIKSISSAETAHRLRLAEFMSLNCSLRYERCEYIEYETYFAGDIPTILLGKYHHIFQETAKELSLPPKTARLLDMNGALAGKCGYYVMQLVKHDKRLLEGTQYLSLLVTAALMGDVEMVKSLLRVGAPVDSRILVTYYSSSPESCPVWMVILGYITIRVVHCHRYRHDAQIYFEMLEALLQHKPIPDCAIILNFLNDLQPQTYLLTLPEIVREMSPKNMDRIISLIEQRPKTWQRPMKHLRALLTRSLAQEDGGSAFDGCVHVKAGDFPDGMRGNLSHGEVVCGHWKLSTGFGVGIY